MIFTDIENEKWYNIGDHYVASNLGRVYSFKKSDFMSFNINAYGYLTVKLRHKGKYATFFQHRIIAMAFIPNPENKPTVNHKNGIKTDNRIENLEWNTIGENNRHAWKTGLCDNQPVITLKCDYCKTEFKRSLRLFNSHVVRNNNNSFCKVLCRTIYNKNKINETNKG